MKNGSTVRVVAYQSSSYDEHGRIIGKTGCKGYADIKYRVQFHNGVRKYFRPSSLRVISDKNRNGANSIEV